MKPNEGFLNSMHEAMALLRTRGPAEATEAIQRALRGEPHADGHRQAPVARAPAPLRRNANLDSEDRSHFDTLSYSNAAGQRQYRLYVPATASAEPMPLIVMLHGCTQNADDFSVGTQMNRLAEQHRCLVAYPVQPQQANPSRCWNWFKPATSGASRANPR